MIRDRQIGDDMTGGRGKERPDQGQEKGNGFEGGGLMSE